MTIHVNWGEESVEEVFQDVINPEPQNAGFGDAVMAEAVKRIEQANLYQTILKHDLFGADSARPEIISLVEAEIKSFALKQLEKLLGISPTVPETAYASPFSAEEIEALKALASRMLVKPAAAPTERSPTINTISAKTAAPALKQPALAAAPKVTAAQPPAPQQDLTKNKASRKKTGNVSEKNGKDYSQATNPNNKPKPMPTASEMEMMAAKQAQSSLNSFNGSGGSAGGMGGILTQAIQASMKE